MGKVVPRHGIKTLLLSGADDGQYSYSVALILSREAAGALIGYSPIKDRILEVRLQVKPYDSTLVQCYAAKPPRQMMEKYLTYMMAYKTLLIRSRTKMLSF